jgi:hypothetical protein
VTQNEIAVQLGAPEVEHPMTQPQLFRRELLFLFASDGNSRGLGWTHNLESGGVHFHLAAGELGIPRGLRSQGHGAGHQHDGLRPERRRSLHDLRRGPLRVEGQLHQTGAITKVYKHKPAQVAASVHPPAKTHLLPQLIPGERTAPMGPQRSGAHQVRASASSNAA